MLTQDPGFPDQVGLHIPEVLRETWMQNRVQWVRGVQVGPGRWGRQLVSGRPAHSPGSRSWKLSSGSHTLLTLVRLALQEP